MFAYCGNNPVNYLDPSGTEGVYFAEYIIYALSTALPGLIAGISAIKTSIEAALASVAVPVICIAAISVAVISIACLIEAIHDLSVMAEQVITWVKAQVEEKKLSEEQLYGYTVYAIVIKGTTDVVYVGMTKNFSSRQYAHQKHPEARFPIESFSMVPVATGLSYKDARALEQTLITAFTLDALVNSINSIAKKNLYKFTCEFARASSLIVCYFDPE